MPNWAGVSESWLALLRLDENRAAAGAVGNFIAQFFAQFFSCFSSNQACEMLSPNERSTHSRKYEKSTNKILDNNFLSLFFDFLEWVDLVIGDSIS